MTLLSKIFFHKVSIGIPLSFEGTTSDRVMLNDMVHYIVILDSLPGTPMTLKPTALKYLGPGNSAETATIQPVPVEDTAITEDLLEDAIRDAVEGEAVEGEGEGLEEVTGVTEDGLTEGGVTVDSRLGGHSRGYTSMKAKIHMDNAANKSPLDYFLYFLPLPHFRSIINAINAHASSVGPWANVTYAEYMMWLALLTVMTVVKHSDKKAYWKQGSSHFHVTVDFSEYMSYML